MLGMAVIGGLLYFQIVTLYTRRSPISILIRRRPPFAGFGRGRKRPSTERKKSPGEIAGAFFIRLGIFSACFYFAFFSMYSTTASTLRFLALPAAVALDAIGLLRP